MRDAFFVLCCDGVAGGGGCVDNPLPARLPMHSCDVGDELHAHGAVIALDDTHEVEPHLGGYGVEFHIEVGGLDEVGDLLAREGLCGCREGALVARLDLHEMVVAIGGEGYDVDFVWRVAPVALHDNVSVVAHCLLYTSPSPRD